MTTVSPEVIRRWRSEFEAYHGAHARFDNGRYVDHADQTLWVCWFKARQSAVIELPEKVSVGFGTKSAFTYILIDQLIEKLEAQGYQVNFNQPTQG